MVLVFANILMKTEYKEYKRPNYHQCLWITNHDILKLISVTAHTSLYMDGNIRFLNDKKKLSLKQFHTEMSIDKFQVMYEY